MSKRYECRLGHILCSTKVGGRCSNEPRRTSVSKLNEELDRLLQRKLNAEQKSAEWLMKANEIDEQITAKRIQLRTAFQVAKELEYPKEVR